MGVRGLVTHCCSNLEVASRTVDLVEQAKKQQQEGRTNSSGQIVLAVDFYSFIITFLCRCEHAVLEAQSDDCPALSPYVHLLGGEPRCYDHWLQVLIETLRDINIELVFFVDGSRGSHCDEFRRKFETNKERDLEKSRAVPKIKAFCDTGAALSSDDKPWTGMMLVRRQLLLTARRLGVHWVQCLGEADEEIVRYAQSHREVFAIVSTDSDFLVTPDCNVIMPDSVDWVPLTAGDGTSTPERFPVPVFCAGTVAESLGLPQSALPGLAALCGNDITKPFIASHNVHKRLKLPSGPVVQAVSAVIKELEDFDIHQHQVIKELVQSDRDFAIALDESLLFYDTSATGKKLTWSLSKTNDHPAPNSFLLFLLNAVENCFLSPSSLSVACNGVLWRDFWLEDLSLGQPTISTLTQSMRSFLHGFLRQPLVEEYGRQEKKNFGVGIVNVTSVQMTVPCADEAQQLSVYERVAWYWKIVSHILEPGMELDKHMQAYLLPLETVGTVSSKADHDMIETVLVSGMLRYFVSLNSLMVSQTAKKCRLQRAEVDSILAMWFTMRNSDAASAIPATAERPTMRCVTVGQWYLSVIQHCGELAGRLRLSHFFPEIKRLFSGSIWASLFAATATTAVAAAPQSIPVSPTDCQQQEQKQVLRSFVHGERSRLLEAPACAPVRDFVYQALPEDIWPVSKPTSISALSAIKSQPEPAATLDMAAPKVAQPVQKPVAEPVAEPVAQPVAEPVQEPVQQQKDLPIAQHREKILAQIRRERITCIQGETGCGKSTSVPLYIFQDWQQQSQSQNKKKAHIIVTQPRRVAAIMLARHVAKLHGQPIGKDVGYSVSRDVAVSKTTCVTYMTIGYLLQVLVNQPSAFGTYTHVVLDEVHERSADADLLSLVIRRLMRRYSDTKLIVMSATLQADLFARYFTSGLYDDDVDPDKVAISPTLFVGVKRFPVREVFLENLVDFVQEFGAPSGVLNSLAIGTGKAMRKFGQATDVRGEPLRASVMEPLMQMCVNVIVQCAKPGQCVLVFLAGLGDILGLHELLSKNTNTQRLRVFALHSLMPANEQEEAFQTPPADTAHIVLATNIAESSLTLPEVACVIDFGLQKEVVFDTRSKRCCLVHSWCSRASAAQRAGRTGRVRPGTVIRLFSEKFYRHGMAEFDSPEIVRLPLDKLVLQVRQLGDALAQNGEERPTPSQLLQEAVQPPSTAQLQAAVESLAEVGALTAPDEEACITSLGRIGLGLPVDLSVARFLMIATALGYAADGVIVAAGLSVSLDVFTLPSHLVMGSGRDYVDSLWRSLSTRFSFDAGEYCEPLMVWRLFRSWLKHRFEARKRLKDGDSYNRVATAQKFCSLNAVSWQRLLTLESLVTDIASRLSSALPRDTAPLQDLRWLSSLSQKQTSLSAGAGHRVHAVNPDRHLTDDADGLRSALVAAFSFNILSASSCDITAAAGGSNQMKKQRKDTTEAIKQHMAPHRTVVASNVPQHLRADGGKKLRDALPPPIGQHAHVQLKGDKAFIVFAEPAPDKSAADRMPYFADLPQHGHLLCQLGGGRNRCMLVPHSAATAPYSKPSAAMAFDSGATAMDNSITINRRNQPCSINWHLVSGGGASEVLCSWRNPIGHARNGARSTADLFGPGEDSFAVAAAIQGTERPGAVHASGVTVLSTELNGFVAQYLLLLFLPHSQKVDFQLNVDSGDLVAVHSGHLRLEFRPALPAAMLSEVCNLRKDISACLDSITLKPVDFKVLQRQLKDMLTGIRRHVAISTAEDATDQAASPTALKKRKQRKIDKKVKKSLKWITVQLSSTLTHLSEMSAGGGSSSTFQLLPPFCLEGLKKPVEEAGALTAHQTADDVAALLSDMPFCHWLAAMGDYLDLRSSWYPLRTLKQDKELQALAKRAQKSLGMSASVKLLSAEFLSSVPILFRTRGSSESSFSVAATEKMLQLVDGFIDIFMDGEYEDPWDHYDPYDPWGKFDPMMDFVGNDSERDWNTCSDTDSDGEDEVDEGAANSRALTRPSPGKTGNGKAAPQTPKKKKKTPASSQQQQALKSPTALTGASSTPGTTTVAKSSFATPVSAAKKTKAAKITGSSITFSPYESSGFYGKKVMRKLNQHLADEHLYNMHRAILNTIRDQYAETGENEVTISQLLDDGGVCAAADSITQSLAQVPGLRQDVRPLTPTFLRSMFGAELWCSKDRGDWCVACHEEDIEDASYADYGTGPADMSGLVSGSDDDVDSLIDELSVLNFLSQISSSPYPATAATSAADNHGLKSASQAKNKKAGGKTAKKGQKKLEDDSSTPAAAVAASANSSATSVKQRSHSSATAAASSSKTSVGKTAAVQSSANGPSTSKATASTKGSAATASTKGSAATAAGTPPVSSSAASTSSGVKKKQQTGKSDSGGGGAAA
eukprot:scpid5141/ scgid5515/ Probable ATP-dependent RNA helicase spindle-E